MSDKAKPGCPDCGEILLREECPRCDGHGKVFVSLDIEDDRTDTCPECSGRGDGRLGVWICPECFDYDAAKGGAA